MHQPVLLKEVIEVLDPKPGEFFIDGTLGRGGHALAILKKISPGGTLLGVDWDKNAVERFRSNVKSQMSNIILVTDNYKNMLMILKNKKLGKAHGLLLDLGLSSDQLEHSGRGFSFLRNEPLLMTYSDKLKPAWRVLSEESVLNIQKIIRNFGEERFAARIAKAIKNNLPITTSKKLTEVVARAVPKNYERGRIHPATRTFQALRIFVNQELENLKILLSQLPQVLRAGGRVAVISFHSLEDRLVKNYFRNLTKKGKAKLLTKKPIIPTKIEINSNPRARGAKLRALKII